MSKCQDTTRFPNLDREVTCELNDEHELPHRATIQDEDWRYNLTWEPADTETWPYTRLTVNHP